MVDWTVVGHVSPNEYVKEELAECTGLEQLWLRSPCFYWRDVVTMEMYDGVKGRGTTRDILF